MFMLHARLAMEQGTMRDFRNKIQRKSIADVLDMTVEDAQEFFKAVPSIREKMDALVRVGWVI